MDEAHEMRLIAERKLLWAQPQEIPQLNKKLRDADALFKAGLFIVGETNLQNKEENKMPYKHWLLESSEEEGMLKQEQEDHEEQARQKLARLLEGRYEEEWKERRYTERKI